MSMCQKLLGSPSRTRSRRLFCSWEMYWRRTLFNVLSLYGCMCVFFFFIYIFARCVRLCKSVLLYVCCVCCCMCVCEFGGIKWIWWSEVNLIWWSEFNFVEWSEFNLVEWSEFGGVKWSEFGGTFFSFTRFLYLFLAFFSFRSFFYFPYIIL